MFNLGEFVKKGLLKAVGKMSDYQVMLNAAEWHKDGVLTESDLVQIEKVIDAQYPCEIAEEAE